MPITSPTRKVINERIGFERILCPIDLLPDSEEALRYAASFARACGAKLLICHCLASPEAQRLSEPAQTIGRRLDGLVKQAGLQESPEFSESFILDGDPVVAIPRVAADKRVDLIVMRSRRWQHPQALLGSIAEAICRMSPCPVLITHPQDREPVEPATDSSLRRVLVAYDFSSDAELALAYGLHLVNKHRAELHLLHILPCRVKTEAPEVAMLPLSARPGFDEIQNRLRSAVSGAANQVTGIKHAMREGPPYREVLAYAEEQGIDLICMGANGTGFGLHALFGSNADRVLRQARCPVIIARPLRPTMPLAS
ncbi:MAG TPA: universal stress protein [Blastocatellia bacterium]|nr:universal stress protein [Blastocatellia bacterium]